MPTKPPTRQVLLGERRGNPGANKKNVRKLFLVITEGKNEYHYITSLRGMIGPTVEVLCFNEADNKLSLMEKALQRRTEMQQSGEYDEEVDETWVVFDRDADPRNKTDKDLFNRALFLGQRESMHSAYSNDAFELWLLLHFVYLDTGQTRKQLNNKLKERLGGKYSKNEPGIYELIVDYGGDRAKAINHAQTLLSRQEGLNPADANPSTTVHLLVSKLEQEFTRTNMAAHHGNPKPDRRNP